MYQTEKVLNTIIGDCSELNRIDSVLHYEILKLLKGVTMNEKAPSSESFEDFKTE